MKRKLLHEKKISELKWTFNPPETGWIELDGLREWAIAIVKNCQEVVNTYIDPHPSNKGCVIKCKETDPFFKEEVRCKACHRFIECFEITEEELK